MHKRLRNGLGCSVTVRRTACPCPPAGVTAAAAETTRWKALLRRADERSRAEAIPLTLDSLCRSLPVSASPALLLPPPSSRIVPGSLRGASTTRQVAAAGARFFFTQELGLMGWASLSLGSPWAELSPSLLILFYFYIYLFPV